MGLPDFVQTYLACETLTYSYGWILLSDYVHSEFHWIYTYLLINTTAKQTVCATSNPTSEICDIYKWNSTLFRCTIIAVIFRVSPWLLIISICTDIAIKYRLYFVYFPQVLIDSWFDFLFGTFILWKMSFLSTPFHNRYGNDPINFRRAN